MLRGVAGVAALVEGGGWTKMVVRSTVGLGLGHRASGWWHAAVSRAAEAPRSDAGCCLAAGASSIERLPALGFGSLAAPLAAGTCRLVGGCGP